MAKQLQAGPVKFQCRTLLQAAKHHIVSAVADGAAFLSEHGGVDAATAVTAASTTAAGGDGSVHATGDGAVEIAQATKMRSLEVLKGCVDALEGLLEGC
jgi:hypothetical protein